MNANQQLLPNKLSYANVKLNFNATRQGVASTTGQFFANRIDRSSEITSFIRF